jgi:hypothetical protein
VISGSISDQHFKRHGIYIQGLSLVSKCRDALIDFTKKPGEGWVGNKPDVYQSI